MNVQLVYRRYPATFWSLTYALKFVSKKDQPSAAGASDRLGHAPGGAGPATG